MLIFDQQPTLVKVICLITNVRGCAVSDPVNHPEHYQQEGIETIDYIRAALGLEGFVAYCAGNVLKYASRPKKGKYAQDLRKAAWYCNRAADELERASKV